MDIMIYAVIAGVLLIAAGFWAAKKASSADQASGGFFLTFLGAVVLVFALLVIFVSRVHARELDRLDRAIVVTVCHVDGGCREVVATTAPTPACVISQPALADWKEHSIYRGEQWSIGRVRCEGEGYQPREAI